MVSYFEQVQNALNYYWEAAEVDQKLKNKITKSAQDIYKISQEKNISLRMGAYVLAIGRISQALRDRGEI